MDLLLLTIYAALGITILGIVYFRRRREPREAASQRPAFRSGSDAAKPDGLSLFLDFNGRINRSTFWLGAVIVYVVNLVAVWLLVTGANHDSEYDIALSLLGFVVICVGLFCAAAIQTKRWHDRDKSAFWLLLNLVPLVGAVWILVECGLLEGSAGLNRYGPPT